LKERAHLPKGLALNTVRTIVGKIVSMNATGSSRQRSHWIRRASVLEIPSVEVPDEHFFERI
jgi:hypothetical protein